MWKGWVGSGEERQSWTHSGCDCLSSGALWPGLGSRHLQETHGVTQRGQGCTGASVPHGDRPAPFLSLILRPGRTCEFSLLGEVGGAGAAGDTNE